MFLDVGAHTGETLAEVRDPRYHFDRIACFEPASECWPEIERLADERVELVRAALYIHDGELLLHDPGSIGASLSAEKATGPRTERCQVIDAARWFATEIRQDDHVYVKINVEGAECDLLEYLMSSGELSKIDHLMVHFDVRKIPAQRHRADELSIALDASGIDWVDASTIMFGRGHGRQTRNWLLYADGGPVTRWLRKQPVRWAYRARQRAYWAKVHFADRGVIRHPR